MRGGICTVQQALTAEAATIVKQAMTLARRRGHAQVTPLHVASAMLATSAGLLRKACLQSHSHPLQFRALELCFNVALNRLPASTSAPLLAGPHSHHHNHHHHHHHPSLSNALVAAFKRAQAQQRRGSIENQQQPILALKIELEHLVISILDDPSVSRVMREAGFSSTQVKNKVEQAVSMEVAPPTNNTNTTTNPPPPPAETIIRSRPLAHHHHHHQFLGLSSCNFNILPAAGRNEDVTEVLNMLVNKSKNTVVVGESAESVVKGVEERLEKGQVPVQFINLPLFSLRNLPKEKLEQKMMEVRSHVKGYMGRGVVLYLGDLKWVSEFWSEYGEPMRSYTYCAVEHIVMEVKRLVSWIRENSIIAGGGGGKLFLLGVANFQTYIRCTTGHPSLDAIWQLHPFTVPADNLALTLNLDRNHENLPITHEYKASKMFESGSVHEKHLISFDMEAQSTASSIQKKEAITTINRSAACSSSSLPLWLFNANSAEKEVMDVKELCKKWSYFGSSSHHHMNLEGASKTAPVSPASSTSACSREGGKASSLHLGWPIIFEPKQQEGGSCNEINEGINVIKPDLLSNPNSSPNSASSSEALEGELDYGFKEQTDENFNILSNGLEKKVPWQKEIIPEMVNTILKSRSRASREVTWLCFQGGDSEAMYKMAKELARLIFGSQASFSSLALSNFSSMADYLGEQSKKRARDEVGWSYLQRFAEALNENPHRVFFMEDIEEVDRCSRRGIRRAMEGGSVSLPGGGEKVKLRDAIVILRCQTLACGTRNLESSGQKNEDLRVGTVSLDLNIAIEDSSYGEDDWSDCADGQFTFRVQE